MDTFVYVLVGIAKTIFYPVLILCEISLLFILGFVFAPIAIIIRPLRDFTLKWMSRLERIIIWQGEGIIDFFTWSGNIVFRIISIVLQIILRVAAIAVDCGFLFYVLAAYYFGIVPLIGKYLRDPFLSAIKRWGKRIYVHVKRSIDAFRGDDEHDDDDMEFDDEYDETEHVFKKDGTWDMRYKVNR